MKEGSQKYERGLKILRTDRIPLVLNKLQWHKHIFVLMRMQLIKKYGEVGIMEWLENIYHNRKK